ncbi:major Facilitator Superfamily protein [Paraburkholderia fungorum]|uniref:MFS transporter n=1 Tax=Paraburkholderia fungorum TaxID=134537 RepID=A0AAP1KWM2_9BURK|nr:MFS transporter [Paraburkholderia fungorum]AJZ59483.1 major Facilitator Superfamily protein [Paraburkholderia fungorum]MBB4514600.1 ACS family hexuronate transporter-like MFS transporter [Paraburkholderia fungorum]MBB6202543.1 ACS family hexuronate transporter-like MFS transporter [Paraburkholderia fungorum]MDT8841283.1 MFS transporter [Paraburkholderia fungorum]PZR43613.1 MAG: MFS transporter [Paraburkholderia fungorum]
MKTIIGLRWWIIALVCAGTIVNYLSRNALGVMAPQLTQLLHMSTKQYSYVVGAFQVGYTIMQPVCGLVIDLIGLRLGFALFACLWSLTGVLHGFASGWLSLAALRGLMGLSEAVAIPAGMKVVAEWFPNREKSVAVGYFNAGTSLGSLLAPPLVVFLSLRYGWQSAFAVTGALGFVWAGVWYVLYRSPSNHPRIGEAERETIVSGQTPGAPQRRSIREVLRTRRFWAIAQARFFAEPAWQTFSFWIPLYLATQRHMDLKQIALFAWLPFLAADLGGLFGGYLSPFLMKHFRMPLIASRIAGVVLGAFMMLGPACIGLVASPYQAIALFCVGGFAHQMISALVNTLAADVFDPSEVGTVAGFAGMSAWIGGLGFSLLVGALADSIGYTPLFGALGAFDLIGATLLIILMRGVTREARPHQVDNHASPAA